MIFLPVSMIKYPIFGTSNTVAGFSLIVAAFDEAGRDDIDITTLPCASIWFFMIQIIVYI